MSDTHKKQSALARVLSSSVVRRNLKKRDLLVPLFVLGDIRMGVVLPTILSMNIGQWKTRFGVATLHGRVVVMF